MTRATTLHLFAGETASRVLRVGEQVILYKSRLHKQSSLVGKRVTYMGVSGTNNGIDKLTFRYYRHSSTLSGQGKVIFPAAMPQSYDSGFSVIGDNTNGTIFPANRTEARNLARSPTSTRFANETIKVNFLSDDTVDIVIEIEAPDISFVKNADIGMAFNWKTSPDNFVVQSHARGWYFATNELVPGGYAHGEHYTCMEGGMMGVTADGNGGVSTYPSWSLSEVTARHSDRDKFYVSTFRKIDDNVGDVGFIQINEHDEIFVEPTEQWTPEFNEIGPVHTVMVGGIRAASRLTINYITPDINTTIALVTPSTESSENPHRSNYTYTASFDAAMAGTSVRFHMPTVTQNDDFEYAAFLADQALQNSIRNQQMQSQQQLQGPPPKFKVGDIVTQKEKCGINLGHRTWRKDWKIIQVTSGGLSSPYRYSIASVVKKNINKGMDTHAYEEELELVDKEKKRKFEITRDFKKYKAGTVMNKEELVNKFQKFQDTAEPLLLNKIYICAE